MVTAIRRRLVRALNEHDRSSAIVRQLVKMHMVELQVYYRWINAPLIKKVLRGTTS